MGKISLDSHSPRTNFILGAAISGGDVKMAANVVAYCRLCDQDGHVPGKECPCCCSNCGGEKDSTGHCRNYCTDEDKDTGAGPQRLSSGSKSYALPEPTFSEDTDKIERYKCRCGCGCQQMYSSPTSNYCRNCEAGDCPHKCTKCERYTTRDDSDGLCNRCAGI